MKKFLLIAMALLMTLSFSFATDMLIDNCDVVSNVSTLANGYANFTTTPWSLVVEADSVNKTEGVASFKITQTNNCSTAVAANWNNGYVDHTFTTPVDITDKEWFQFDVKNEQAITGLTLLVVLFDENGQAARYWPTGIFGTSAGFRTISLRLSDFQKDTWTVSGKSVNMKKIVKIRYQYANAGAMPAGAFTYWIDNVRFAKNISKVVERPFINFDEFATTATYDQITSVWVPAFSFGTSKNSGYNSSGIMQVTDQWPTALAIVDVNGKKTLKMNYNHYNKWSNFALNKTFAAPVDLTGIKYMKVTWKGSTTYGGYMNSTGAWVSMNPIATLFMTDTLGRRVEGDMYGAPSTDGWYTFILPFQGGANNGISYTASSYNSCWKMNSPTNVMISLAAISSVHIAINTQVGNMTNDTSANASINWVYPKNMEFSFGEVVAGYETKPLPVTGGADKNYTVNFANAPTVDGVANDVAWNQASNVFNGDFVSHDSILNVADEEAKFKMTYDNDKLYFLFQAPQNYLGLDFTPASGDRDPTGTAFSGDDLELFIAPYGPNATNYYHVVLFPDITNNRVLIWDEINAGGAASYNGTGDNAALTFANGTVTIEYALPFAMLNKNLQGNLGKPANGDIWGCQIGFINRMVVSNVTTTEFVNWEPDGTAGFASGRPFGALTFNQPALAVSGPSVVSRNFTGTFYAMGGVAPYTWSLSSSSSVLTNAYGSINQASGDSVVFSATALGSVTLYLTDSQSGTPNTASYTFSVIPTSAPLASELMD